MIIATVKILQNLVTFKKCLNMKMSRGISATFQLLENIMTYISEVDVQKKTIQTTRWKVIRFPAGLNFFVNSMKTKQWKH